MNQGVDQAIPFTNGVGNGHRNGVGKYFAVCVGISQRMCNSHAAKSHGGFFVDSQNKPKTAAQTIRL